MKTAASQIQQSSKYFTWCDQFRNILVEDDYVENQNQPVKLSNLEAVISDDTS